MKKFIVIILFCLVGCTKEEKSELIEIKINNEANVDLQIKFYDQSDALLDTIFIESQSIYECSYLSENGYFQSIRLCSRQDFFANFGKVEFIFANNKGYQCTLSTNNLCFSDSRNDFLNSDASDFIEISKNVYSFVLTQQDFNSAFDLP